MVHAFNPSPDTNIPASSPANSRFWDFISLTPESTHIITWLFSDRGTVKSYRTMEGFGVNTLEWGMPHEAPAVAATHEHLEGDVSRRKISLTNDFEQAGARYRSLGNVDKEHLVGNIVEALGRADKPIQRRMVEDLAKADNGLGRRVADGLKLRRPAYRREP